MNARPSIHELDRIRRDIGARLRIEHAVTEPAPESLIALLKELETSVREAELARVRDAELDRRFAEVEACVTALLRATGRQAEQNLTSRLKPEAASKAHWPSAPSALR
jgi:hypothetical protein